MPEIIWDDIWDHIEDAGNIDAKVGKGQARAELNAEN